MSEPRSSLLAFLLAFPGAPPPRFTEALGAIPGRVLLALPRHVIVLAPEGAREALARLPGVTHAGGVNLPQQRLPRLRVGPDGQPWPKTN